MDGGSDVYCPQVVFISIYLNFFKRDSRKRPAFELSASEQILV